MFRTPAWRVSPPHHKRRAREVLCSEKASETSQRSGWHYEQRTSLLTVAKWHSWQTQMPDDCASPMMMFLFHQFLKKRHLQHHTRWEHTQCWEVVSATCYSHVQELKLRQSQFSLQFFHVSMHCCILEVAVDVCYNRFYITTNRIQSSRKLLSHICYKMWYLYEYKGCCFCFERVCCPQKFRSQKSIFVLFSLHGDGLLVYLHVHLPVDWV